MKITEALNLCLDQREINFVDLNFEVDTILFLDPFSFEKKQNVFCKESLIVINSFFEEIKKAIRDKNETRLTTLLEHTSEAIYLPLGYSVSRKRGSGAGTELRARLINNLLNEYNDSFRDSLSILNDFGNIPGIKNDIISDIIGNLISVNLSKYTVEQCKLHNKESFLTETIISIWSTDEKNWVKTKLPILNLNEKKLFLIPRDILRTNVINMRNTLSSYLVKENIMPKRDQSLNKLEILNIMNTRSDLYVEFIENRIETDKRVKTLSRENLIKKFTNEDTLNRLYKIPEGNISELAILDFKEIIEFLFVEYITCPSLVIKNDKEFLVYNNLKEKNKFDKTTDYIFFIKNNVHRSVDEYSKILSLQDGIGIVLIMDNNLELEHEVKEFCQKNHRKILFITINEITKLLSYFKIGNKVKFRKIDNFLNSKWRKLL